MADTAAGVLPASQPMSTTELHSGLAQLQERFVRRDNLLAQEVLVTNDHQSSTTSPPVRFTRRDRLMISQVMKFIRILPKEMP